MEVNERIHSQKIDMVIDCEMSPESRMTDGPCLAFVP